MRLRFNPRRAAVCAMLLSALWLWPHMLLGIKRLALLGAAPFSLNGLDQTHIIAAMAVIGITGVGVVKLLLRR